MAEHELSEKYTVLVVDDDPVTSELLNELLKDKYNVRLSGNGAEALTAAQQLPLPHAILLDVMMPDMDGYEVCARLKADNATKDIPVIFLTAKDQADDAQLGFDLGGADYITKPFLPVVVLARVDAHVSLKAARNFLKGQDSI